MGGEQRGFGLVPNIGKAKEWKEPSLLQSYIALYLGKGYLPEVALLSHPGILLQIPPYSSSAAASEGSSAFCIIAKAPVIKAYAAGQKIKTWKYNLHFGIWAFRTRLLCIFKHVPVSKRSSQVLCGSGSSTQQPRLGMETSESCGSHNRATGVVAVPRHDRESPML